MYPQSEEDVIAHQQLALIELSAYAYQRQHHSYERLKNAGYPNVDELEKEYRGLVHG